jgi:small subunit ribosomal protein S8e
MAQWQGRSKRKPSGGRLRPIRGKRKFEIGREDQFAFVGEPTRKTVRTRGGNQKMQLFGVSAANVVDPRTGKTTKTKVTSVLENPANPNYVQRNIITKGAIIMTDLGKARVTSKPGQHGVLNAVLIEE